MTLEFRQPFGTSFDTFPFTSLVANTITIRITPHYDTRTQSQLVDATPSTSSASDAPLPVGGTLVDPLTGTSITTIAVSSPGATVRVSLGVVVPTPSLTPAPTPSPTPTPTPSPTPTPTPMPA